MPIITNDITPEMAFAKFRIRIDGAFKGYVRNYKAAFDEVWRRTDGITPAQFVEAMGTEGLETFVNSAATRDYIESIVPGILDGYMSPLEPVNPELDGTGQPTGRMIVG